MPNHQKIRFSQGSVAIQSLLAAMFMAVIIAPELAAETLPSPVGRVILSISGNIDNTNAGGSAVFDRQMLEQLGLSSITTSTSWTDGKPQFEGVLGRDILRAIGARGATLTATALNDYSVDIPIEDFENYRVLFAMSMDGVALTARDKGPLWIVYPRDDYAELQNQNVDAKWLWQLTKIVVK